MNVPDLTTMIIILGELLIIAYLLLNISRTSNAINEYQNTNFVSSEKGIQFAVYRSRASAYTLIAFPLLLLGCYLALWILWGMPSWGNWGEIINPGLNYMFAIFFSMIFLLPSYLLTIPTASKFVVVSGGGIEEHRARRTITSIIWEEVTAFDVSSNDRYPSFISVRSEKKDVRIDAHDKGIINRDRFIDMAMKKVPSERRTPRLVKWVDSN